MRRKAKAKSELAEKLAEKLVEKPLASIEKKTAGHKDLLGNCSVCGGILIQVILYYRDMGYQNAAVCEHGATFKEPPTCESHPLLLGGIP